MKSIIILILLFTITGFIGVKNSEGIPLKRIGKLLCNDWSYQYSINNGIKQVISDEIFVYGPNQVFFKIEFWKFSNKQLKRFYIQQHSDYKAQLNGNALEGIEMFGDYKGCTEYPMLLNDSTDLDGNLIECKIQTFWNCDNGAPVKSKMFYIDKLTQDSLIISGYLGDSRENKIVYSRMK